MKIKFWSGKEIGLIIKNPVLRKIFTKAKEKNRKSKNSNATAIEEGYEYFSSCDAITNHKKLLNELGCPHRGRGLAQEGTERYENWLAGLSKEDITKIVQSKTEIELAIKREQETKKAAKLEKKERRTIEKEKEREYRKKTRQEEKERKKAEKKEESERKRIEKLQNSWAKHNNIFDNLPENFSGEDYANWLNTILIKNPNDEILTKEKIVKDATLLKDFEIIHDPEFISHPKGGEFVFCGEIKCEKPTIHRDLTTYLDENAIEWSRATDKPKEIVNTLYYATKGVVYIFTCIIDGDEYLIKIGETGEVMKDRIGSYDCGNALNRFNGTCSTTNYKFKQSLASGLILRVYLLDCSKYNSKLKICGITSCETSSAVPRQIEEILNKAYEQQYGKKPVGNVQTKKNKPYEED